MNSNYSITGVQTNQAGNYSVVVTNASGSITSSNALLFVDNQKPTITITNPATNARLSNAVAQVSGTASDNGQVAQVFYQLNSNGWMLASGTSSWQGSVNLITPGTNILSAYSVDWVGNISVTNSKNIIYVVTALATVHTNGNGTILPNYNGQLLEIGQNYSMTATAAAGFAFVNWTGSITTNNATLIFTMASNLTFTANFVDTSKPVILITNITAGMLVSNVSLTVMGTATDNVAVASVYCSLSNAVVNTGFGLAATANKWANWSTNVTLTPGTNTIRANAVDTSGNVSATNSVSFVYVLSAVLAVNTNGNGTINPNYNGVLLQIGNTYSMTATATAGFAFTNWTGSIRTNGATLVFTMASNLTFTANFIDVQKPVVTVTNVTAGLNVSNAAFTVKGTATDNVAVASVYFSLSNAVVNTGFAPATTANNWANWSTNLTLTPGTNTVRAYAVDTSGNLSTTNTLNFDYVVSAVLMVSTNGLGSLNPNYSGALLQVDKNYSITATAGTGFTFTNWMGSTLLPLTVLTNGATLQFVMQSNLVLQANFVDTSKPTLSITNLALGQRLSNAVFTAKGTATDNWQVASVQYQLNGGTWTNATGTTNWSALLTLTPGTNKIAAFATDTTGNNSATNSMSFQFMVTNRLGLQATGLGTISPNYSNSWLEIGRNYSITSTPASGFVFTNWTISTNWIGGTTTSKTNLLFMMASNLTLQANFWDVTKPTLVVSSPTAGQKMTNALATVVGTATDNWKVNAVWYQLNSDPWNLVNTTTNNYTNWTQTVTLVAGTNTLKAYAVDLGGNYSTTNSLSVVSSNTFMLQLAFTNALPLKTNGLVFNLQLSKGLNGHIQVSTNLTSWTTLTNFVGTNSTISFRDPAATNSPRRFYRAVIP
jgi:hypothetical protein